MLTYPSALRSRTGLPALLACLALAWPQSSEAQERSYRFELGAAGAYQSFDDATNLGGGAGGLGRLGIWLPANFSAEVEGAFTSPKTKETDVGVSVKSIGVSALYNFLVGSTSSIYLKAGVGSTKYGGDCPAGSSGGDDPPCGSSGTLLGGVGFRVGLSPVLMIRSEGLFSRNKSKEEVGRPRITVSNFGFNLGLSYMLGSRPIPDSDGDGILDNRDRCADTPTGAQVDGRGCTEDSDGDGVPNGVDRCGNTPTGATTDPNGCTRDSDGDNIADGLDRCPETPAGVLVDPRGCPKDSDGDAIADGLDRCSDTPRGATVDALGCPGDEDGDGVLDGLDRCPRTTAGATVNPQGCAEGQTQVRQRPNAPAPPAPQMEPRRLPPRDTTTQQPQPAAPPPEPAQKPAAPGMIVAGVVPGVGFVQGTARLRPESFVVLDSIAEILLANTQTRVEISAHTDNSGAPADNLRLSALQAEAVRNYLVNKGVPLQQMVARGYGATVPLTPDTTPRGRAANRRIEIRAIPPGL
jgi:outer membrane protein OmpA-like peptidoglycan-associated protein/opacity protein-like surface antigen